MTTGWGIALGVAMATGGMGATACDKPHDTSPSSAVSSDVASPSASASASVTAIPAPVVVDAALPTPTPHWTVAYSNPNRLLRCAEPPLDCFPRASVPGTWGKVRMRQVTQPPRPASELPLGCPASVDVSSGCTPGGKCDPEDPYAAPFVLEMSEAQSSLYEGGACCYAPPQRCISPGAGVGAPATTRAPASTRGGVPGGR